MLNSTRALSFPNLLNVRDLGGCATRQGELTRWRSLLRADELAQLTPAGVKAMLDYGVRTVIDLRWPAEAEAAPSIFQVDPGEVHYLPISLLGASEAEWRTHRPQVNKDQWNCMALDYAQPGIRAVMRAMATAPEDGLVFHCAAGKDRTGFIAALLLALAEVNLQEIVEDYTISTENLREAYLAAGAEDRAAALERLNCPPEQIYNMLAYLGERYGGAAAYLGEIGLSEAEIEQISKRLGTRTS
jgi:protein-tyrosine phosphatase